MSLNIGLTNVIGVWFFLHFINLVKVYVRVNAAHTYSIHIIIGKKIFLLLLYTV